MAAEIESAIRRRDKTYLSTKYSELISDLRSKSFLQEGKLFELVGEGVQQLNRNIPAEAFLPISVVSGESKRECKAVR